jgi:hypothetical protein
MGIMKRALPISGQVSSELKPDRRAAQFATAAAASSALASGESACQHGGSVRYQPRPVQFADRVPAQGVGRGSQAARPYTDPLRTARAGCGNAPWPAAWHRGARGGADHLNAVGVAVSTPF